MLKNSKWRSRVIIHARARSSDLLEVAASAAAIFNKHISKVCFVRIQSRGHRNRKPIQRIRFL